YAGLAAGLAGMVASQMFGFSTVSTQVYLFVGLAIIASSKTNFIVWSPAQTMITRLVPVAVCLLVVCSSYYLIAYVYANVQFGTSRSYIQGQFDSDQTALVYLQQSIDSLESAIASDPHEPNYKLALATAFIRISGMIADSE